MLSMSLYSIYLSRIKDIIDKTDDKKVFTREEIGNYERLHYNNSILV